MTAQVERPPAALSLYDDAGAACDRLHRDGEAIQWMRRKATAMKQYGATPDDRYRYHANLGTFMVHRWLREGHNPKRIAEVDHARAEIAQALALNPQSHLGRERQQLAVMDWLRELVKGDPKGSRATRLDGYLIGKAYADRKDGAKPDLDGTIQGVAGLVVLGDAWESRDIFDAMMPLLYRRRRYTVAYLAELRSDELRRQGRPTLAELLSSKVSRSTGGAAGILATPNAIAVRRKFRELRAEAEEWQRHRTDFMLARLSHGSHPDTDPHFWDGFRDRRPPGLAPNVWEWVQIRLFTIEYGTLALILLALGFFLFFLWWGVGDQA